MGFACILYVSGDRATVDLSGDIFIDVQAVIKAGWVLVVICIHPINATDLIKMQRVWTQGLQSEIVKPKYWCLITNPGSCVNP